MGSAFGGCDINMYWFSLYVLSIQMIQLDRQTSLIVAQIDFEFMPFQGVLLQSDSSD